jgi:hypothetical protein
MTARGVLYIAWGKALPYVERSLASLRRHHPELPVHLERLPDETDSRRGLAFKASMAARSPFESTLFLDADTIVLDRLDFGFDKAERFGLACAICECPWARRFAGVGSGDMVEYNTGVLFFARGARPVFDAWERLAPSVDSQTRWLDADGQMRGMEYNDQASFALAVEEAGISPYVLPQNWNFRPDWQRSLFAPIKIWHDYREVPEPLLAINRACAGGEQPVRYVEFARRS